MRINVLQTDHGWLFSDLARKFELYGADEPNVEVVLGDAPDPSADAYLWIRTAEAARHPELLDRSLVQVHDVFEEYEPGSPRRIALQGARAVGVYSPFFVDFLRGQVPELSPESFVVVPIGYDERFTRRESLSDGFTVGFVAQHWPDGIKGEDRLEEVLRTLGTPTRLIVLGIGWQRLVARLEGIPGVDVEFLERYVDVEYENYPSIYRRFDALVCTSRTEGIPTTFFEAMATGVPVVTLPVGAVADLVTPENGRIVDDVEGVARALEEIAAHRDEWLARGPTIRGTVEGLTNRSFVRTHLRAACAVAVAHRLERGRSSPRGAAGRPSPEP